MGVAVWSLVVALGSTLVWVVISRAGEGVVSSSGTPAATFTDQPSSPVTSTEPSGSPSTQPPASVSTNPSPTSTPQTVTPVRRTWQGVGGQVTVECRGSAASFVNAIPNSGFGFEIDDRGPRRVRVELEHGGDGGRSRIEASCLDDTPIFEVDVDED